MSKKRKTKDSSNRIDELILSNLPKDKKRNKNNTIQQIPPNILFEDINRNNFNQNLPDFSLYDENCIQEELNVINNKEFIGVRSGFPKNDIIIQEEKDMLLEHLKIKKKEEKYLISLLNKKKKIIKNSNDDYDCLSFSNSTQKNKKINESINTSIDDSQQNFSNDLNNIQTPDNIINTDVSEDSSSCVEHVIDDEFLKNTKLSIINNCEICKISLIDELSRDESPTIKLVRILNSSSTSGSNKQLINLIYHSRKECVETPAIKNSLKINFWTQSMIYYHVNGYCDSINPMRVNNCNIQKIQNMISQIYENEIICEDPTGQKLIDQNSLNKIFKCVSMQHKCLLFKNQLLKEKSRAVNNNNNNNNSEHNTIKKNN